MSTEAEEPAGAGDRGVDHPPLAPAPGRVVVIDDDAIVRDGLAALLPGFPPGHQVVAAYTHVEAMLRDRPEADVVIVDLDLRGASRLGLTGDLEAQLALVGLTLADTGLVASPTPETGMGQPRLGVAAVRAVCEAGYTSVVYTSGDNRIVLAACIAAGAAGVVHKIDPPEAVAKAVTDVMAGQIVLTPSLVGLVEVLDRRNLLPTLSPRQRQVLAALAKGDPQKWIARDLGVATKTVDYHWETTKAKFAETLRGLPPSELQRILGLGPVDLLDDNR